MKISFYKTFLIAEFPVPLFPVVHQVSRFFERGGVAEQGNDTQVGVVRQEQFHIFARVVALECPESVGAELGNHRRLVLPQQLGKPFQRERFVTLDVDLHDVDGG